MEMTKWFKAFALMTTLALPMVSCDDDDDVKVEPEVCPTTYGVLILNRGNYQANNASLKMYDFTARKLTDLYQNANGVALGESAQDVITYGSKIYAAVTFSNSLTVMEKDGTEIKKIQPVGEDGKSTMNPRYMAAANGKVYVSYYYGHSVAVVDTSSLAVEKVIPVGRYPEGVAVANNKLYVANSGGLDEAKGNTVSVIDLNSLKVEKEIKVEINPVNIVADGDGDLYLISMGNYGDIKNTLQSIDGKTGAVKKLGLGSRLAYAKEKLYVAYAQWGDPNITYSVYDTKTNNIITDKFITDGTNVTPGEGAAPTSIDADPVSGNVAIASGKYGATTTLYVFTPEGKLAGDPIETEGYDTQKVVFLAK